MRQRGTQNLGRTPPMADDNKITMAQALENMRAKRKGIEAQLSAEGGSEARRKALRKKAEDNLKRDAEAQDQAALDAEIERLATENE